MRVFSAVQLLTVSSSSTLLLLYDCSRWGRSEATGERARETCNINKSLSCLGDVFAALARKQAHVPYRNSKLTFLLQPCLGGDGKTLMFVNINPEPASAGETLCSLRFAGQVNACELGGKGGGSGGGAKRNVSTVSLSEPYGRRPLAGTRHIGRLLVFVPATLVF